MKINAKDIGKNITALTYLLLEAESEFVNAVVNTLDGKEERIIKVDTYFNGVKYDASVLENVLQKLHKQMEDSFKKKYEDVEKEIQKRADEKAKSYVKNLKKEKLNILEGLKTKLYKLAEDIETLELQVSCLDIGWNVD